MHLSHSDPKTQHIEKLLGEFINFPKHFKDELGKIIIGQETVIDLLLVSLLCQGHVLLTGVPGLAKTLLIRSLAQLFHLDFNRIQCTPDLMPSDITGFEVLDESQNHQGRTLRFIEGPVFTHLLLVDEINRASPRTQAALLQAMQEKMVSNAGKHYPLSDPFIVFATQNPIDSEGTYPLPEAQLDRFLLQIDVPYPSAEQERKIALQWMPNAQVQLQPLFHQEQLLAFGQLVQSFPIGQALVDWIVEFVRMTRPQENSPSLIKNYVEWGAGVRASQFVVRAAKARGLLQGRVAVSAEDVHDILIPVLQHRLILNFKAQAEGKTAVILLQSLLQQFKGMK